MVGRRSGSVTPRRQDRLSVGGGGLFGTPNAGRHASLINFHELHLSVASSHHLMVSGALVCVSSLSHPISPLPTRALSRCQCGMFVFVVGRGGEMLRPSFLQPCRVWWCAVFVQSPEATNPPTTDLIDEEMDKQSEFIMEEDFNMAS